MASLPGLNVGAQKLLGAGRADPPHPFGQRVAAIRRCRGLKPVPHFLVVEDDIDQDPLRASVFVLGFHGQKIPCATGSDNPRKEIYKFSKKPLAVKIRCAIIPT